MSFDTKALREKQATLAKEADDILHQGQDREPQSLGRGDPEVRQLHGQSGQQGKLDREPLRLSWPGHWPAMYAA